MSTAWKHNAQTYEHNMLEPTCNQSFDWQISRRVGVSAGWCNESGQQLLTSLLHHKINRGPPDSLSREPQLMSCNIIYVVCTL